MKALTKSTAIRILRSAVPPPIPRVEKLSEIVLMVALAFHLTKTVFLRVNICIGNGVEENESTSTEDSRLETYMPSFSMPHILMWCKPSLSVLKQEKAAAQGRARYYTEIRTSTCQETIRAFGLDIMLDNVSRRNW